jgi:YVTN family beta-propeller protein
MGAMVRNGGRVRGLHTPGVKLWVVSKALVTLFFRLFLYAIGLAAASSWAQAPAMSLSLPVLVLNSRDADVSVIDPKTWLEVKRIPTGKEPHHLYLTPDEKSIIVANAASDSLTFIDPKTAEVQRTMRGILDPYHLRFSPDMKWFVVASNRLNHVDVYQWDGKDPKLLKRIPTGKTPSHMWIDSKSTVAYVSMQDSDELVAIDLATQSIRWRTPTGAMPADVYLSADDKTLLLALTGSDSVQVWDVSGREPRLAKRIKTGAGAHAFRAAGDKRHVFVSNRVANTISKIDLQTLDVVESFAAPGGPDCMDISSDGKLLLVSSRWAKKLTLISLETRKIVRQVNVGSSPHGVWTFEHVQRQ